MESEIICKVGLLVHRQVGASIKSLCFCAWKTGRFWAPHVKLQNETDLADFLIFWQREGLNPQIPRKKRIKKSKQKINQPRRHFENKALRSLRHTAWERTVLSFHSLWKCQLRKITHERSSYKNVCVCVYVYTPKMGTNLEISGKMFKACKVWHSVIGS